MSKEKDIELYEKIETICQRIDAYTTKVITVKSEAKTIAYTKKIQKLLEMIETNEKIQSSGEKIIEEKEQTNEPLGQENSGLEKNKYDPYSDDFCYRDRLDRLNGDIELLLEELKNEDKLGYRNAYVINEIKKNVEQRQAEELRKQMLALSKNKTTSSGIFNTIRNIIQKIKESFKGNNSKKYKKEEI